MEKNIQTLDLNKTERPAPPPRNVKKKKGGKKAKRRRARRRRRLIISFILIVVAVVAVIFAILKSGILDPIPEKTSLTIRHNGSIIYDEVTPVTSEYDMSKLEDFAREQVDSYTPAPGEYVRLIKVKADDEKAFVRMEYSSIQEYSSFTGYTAFLGSISDAMKKGFDFDTSFKDASDGSPVSREEVILDTSRQVFIIRENTTVVTDNKILYVSGEGTNVSEGEVVISSGDGSQDTAPLCYIVFDR